MKRARTLAVTALSAAVLAGGVTLASATSASAGPISGDVEQSGESQDAGSTGGIDDPDELSEEQIDNARTIIGVGKGADLS